MFIPLRIHSVFSKGKGAVTLGEAGSWASHVRLPAAALSDIGNLYGWAKWKREAEEAGFAPLFGCELEIAGRRFLLLVRTREGYWHLVEALNRKELAGFEGLVVILIPNAASPVDSRFFDEGQGLRLRESGDFYIGCDFFNFPRANLLGRELNLPLVWANPLKFIRGPERLILMRALDGKIPYPPERDRLLPKMKFFGPDQEALALRTFGRAVQEPLARTLEVAGKCRFDFAGIVPHLPADLFPAPLREVVMAALRGPSGLDLRWEERQRVLRELEVIEGSGFAPYFMIVHDVVEFARRRGILHNLKGSGASSFVAYLLGLSHVNPVEFDLYFERFLNPGRDDPPDIDLDFDSRRRDEVLAYVLERYGGGANGGGQVDGNGARTGAAFVCSLKTYGARSALYDTARAFGIAPEEARGLSNRAPFFAEPDWLKKDRPLAGYAEVWRLAADLGGVFCEKSLHVGGVILTPAPADRFLPLEESAKGLVMSHFDRDAVEDLKLIKLDLLSVRGLAAISQTKESLGLRALPAGDAKVYSLLKSARTIGCFQVESPAMMNLMRRMKPGDIHDLTRMLALIRPGPTESGMKEALLRGREGRPVARDPFLERILPETGGLLLYEEQVMQAAERVAGMSPAEGDILRRSLKKRGRAEKGGLRERFFRGARERGYAAGEVERLWTTLERFSSYSFNKAHSASYAGMAYQAVYLKAHHPVPYITAVLNAGGGYYDLAEYIEEAKRMGIRILPPDANRSLYEFEVEGQAVRVGLTSIKGLAVRTAERIIEERKNGEYLSVEDFLGRVRPTRAELLALMRAGVFDALEPRRTRQILRYVQGLEDMTDVADLDAREKARLLYESLGFLPEGDTLTLFEGGKRPELRISDLAKYEGQAVELVVRVVDARYKATNSGRKYFYLFEDETGLLEGVGETRCPTFGRPPLCWLRAEVRASGNGRPRAMRCSFVQLR